MDRDDEPELPPQPPALTPEPPVMPEQPAVTVLDGSHAMMDHLVYHQGLE